MGDRGHHAVLAVAARGRADHLVHAALQPEPDARVTNRLVAEAAADVGAHARELEAVAAVPGRAVPVERVVHAVEREAVSPVAFRDGADDGEARAARQEPVEAVLRHADVHRAAQRLRAVGDDADAEMLDRTGPDEQQAAAHDEDPDTLSVARDRPAVEIEGHGAGGGDEQTVRRA